MSRQRVSAIIPVYNGTSFLAEAVASIREQSVPPDEIVIVHDGSSDGTADLAASLGDDIRIVQHPANRGVPVALNSGVDASSGDVITFLDVDDLWPAGALHRQLTIAQGDPAVDLVVGHTQRMQLVNQDQLARRFEPWGKPQLALCVGATLFRRRAFDRIGGFDESLPFGSDWDWFMRAREQEVAIRVHPATVLYYRRHGQNMTEDPIGNHYALQMLRKSLERRRQSSDGPIASLPDLPAG